VQVPDEGADHVGGLLLDLADVLKVLANAIDVVLA
jgi:hypothetical protein